jgi:hypothetical protein
MEAHWQTIDKLRKKLERAVKHINELKFAWDGFHAEAYPVLHEDNPKTGDRTYYVGNIIPIPPEMSLMIGDAVHNLRSALDHIAYRLVCKCLRSNGPFKDVYFPIAETPLKFEEARKRASESKTKTKRVIKRMRKGAIKALRTIEPYEGGRGAIFWHLHCLNIIDKHRLLLTMRPKNPSHGMLPSKRAEIAKKFLGLSDSEPIPDGRAFQTDSKISKLRLKAGRKLLTVKKSEIEDYMYFRFEIAFGEPKVIRGDSVVVKLHQIADRIHDIISTFDSARLL